MRGSRPPRLLVWSLALVLSLAFVFLASAPHGSHAAMYAYWSASPPTSRGRRDGPLSSSSPLAAHSPDAGRATNATLGFAKVMVVGLPERSDKHDALSLMSSLAGLQLDWVDGVKGADIVQKARPFGHGRPALSEANLGSWRGHVNAIRRIVDEGLSSALIMEDDMDWDVRLKAQLVLIAHAARVVAPAPAPAPDPPSSHHPPPQPHSPYGDGWDLLWLGHCGEPFPEDLEENRRLPRDHPARRAMSRKYAILNDDTVPSLDKLTGLVDFARYAEHTRWVHVTAAPICSFAYALSQRGARKVLYSLAVDRAGLREAYDNALAGLCRRSLGSLGALAAATALVDAKADNQTAAAVPLPLQCLSVTPPLFFHHRARGPVAADSDINHVTDDDRLLAQGRDGQVREKGSTENIVWSMRLNLGNLLAAKPMESQ